MKTVTIIGLYIDTDVKQLVNTKYSCEVGNVLYVYPETTFEETLSLIDNRFKYQPYYTNVFKLLDWMENQNRIKRYNNLIEIKSTLFVNDNNRWFLYSGPIFLFRQGWQLYDFRDKRWRDLYNINGLNTNRFRQ